MAHRQKVEGGGGLLALEATGILTQDAEPDGTSLDDARNGFNKLIQMAMLWIMRHRWPAGARFAFNFCRH